MRPVRPEDLGESSVTTVDSDSEWSETPQTPRNSRRSVLSRVEQSSARHSLRLRSTGLQTGSSRTARDGSRCAQQQQNTPRTRPRQSRKQKKPLSQFERFQREYERLAKDIGFMCPKKPFMRVIREILLSMSDDQLRITAQAFQAIQTAAEYYLTKVLQDAYLLAIHARRVTLLVRDIELLNFMRNNT